MDNFRGLGTREPHVDHDHDTGKVCKQCNVALGWIDRPGWIAKAVDYIYPHIVPELERDAIARLADALGGGA